MGNLIQISLFALIIIVMLIGAFIIYFLLFWHLRELRSEKELYKIMADDLEINLNDDESLQEYETLLNLINHENHFLKRENEINNKVRDLKVIVYFDFLMDKEAELPTVIIGAKFLDGENKVLFDLLVDKYGDGCIKSDRSNEIRKNKIMIAVIFAEYYLNKECIYSNREIKVTKVIKTALPISGLNNIEGYNLELIS